MEGGLSNVGVELNLVLISYLPTSVFYSPSRTSWDGQIIPWYEYSRMWDGVRLPPSRGCRLVSLVSAMRLVTLSSLS